MLSISEIKELLLKGNKNIVITSHLNPDGDAVGSSLGLMFFLQKYNNNVSVILPDKIPDFLEWMPESKNILVYKNFTPECKKKIEHSDIIFCLDYNDLSRIGEMENSISISKAKKIMIDHHKNPTPFSDYTYSDISVSSTSELIYNFIEKLGQLNMFDKYIAICLYTGIMTDTGSFRFKTTTSFTHKIISAFLDKGIDIEEIHKNIYDVNTLDRYKLLSIALNNMKVKNNIAYTFISSEDFLLIENSKSGITEGFVNYGLGLKDVILSAIFIEKKDDGIIKISLRSKGNLDVDEISRKYFKGGGHKNASGGKSELSLKETLVFFENFIIENLNSLPK